MNQEIRDILTRAIVANNWAKEEEVDDDCLRGLIDNFKTVHQELQDEHRWYFNRFNVIELEDKLIGFWDFKATGDTDNSDVNINLNKVCFVTKTSKMVDVYEPIQ